MAQFTLIRALRTEYRRVFSLLPSVKSTSRDICRRNCTRPRDLRATMSPCEHFLMLRHIRSILRLKPKSRNCAKHEKPPKELTKGIFFYSVGSFFVRDLNSSYLECRLSVSRRHESFLLRRKEHPSPITDQDLRKLLHPDSRYYQKWLVRLQPKIGRQSTDAVLSQSLQKLLRTVARDFAEKFKSRG